MTLPKYTVPWHGYDGAIPAAEVERHHLDPDRNNIVHTKDGRCFNTHPKAHACGGATWHKLELIESVAGVYPIRWEIL